MKRRLLYLLLSLSTAGLALAVLLLLPHRAYTAPPHSDQWQDKLDPALRSALAESPTATHAFILHFPAAADLSAESLPAGREARHAAVVARLQAVAEASQTAALDELSELQTAGHITDYRPLWIINAIVAEGDEAALQRLATRPDIGHITLDAPLELEEWEPIPLEGELRQHLGGGLPTPWGLLDARVPQAQHGLGVNGQGIVIGIMDSGVDWLHPALQGNYRGNLGGGNVNHAGNWFDATNWYNLYPLDPYGHGTHVAGTAVGGEGLGVAPGAKWIAVRAFDALGMTTYGIIHDAFQWLLAPAGDPTLAPDVVNGSWSGPGNVPDFLPDVQALHAAGIITVFATGNNGNAPGTIGAPATYTNTIAAAAHDMRGQVTWFSSAGPSLFTSHTKPTLTAPGARVLSSLPGGVYGYASGTSMSAPHIAGVTALLLSANGNLTRPVLTQILTSTTRPLSGSEPNPLAGWGALDAYAALRNQVPAGRVSGSTSSNGAPLAAVTVTVTTAGSPPIFFHSDSAGNYDLSLKPGSYTLQFSRFGYQSVTLGPLAVTAGANLVHNIALPRLPHGTLSGTVREAGSNAPLPAVIRVAGLPVSTTAGSNGSYSLALPAGTYDLIATHTGHALGRATVTIPANGTLTQDFTLDPTERLLLVDAGWWTYSSQAPYYRDSLADLDLAHDEWPIYNPLTDVPVVDDLTAYDTVLWSDPANSPGTIGAGGIISDYLSAGGELFISGRNIGAYDGGTTPQAWWFIGLRAIFENQLIPVGEPPVSGQPDTLFAGLDFTLNGGDGAANQLTVDRVAPLPNSYTAQAFNYGDLQMGAGLARGKCVEQGYHVVYLGFGLEGVSDPASRTAILERTFDFFATPPAPAGVRLQPTSWDDLVVPGNSYTYDLTLHNDGELITDTFTLAASAGDWPVTLSIPSLTVGPCRSLQSQLTVTVPAGLPRDVVQSLTITATSTNDPSYTAVTTASLKTPGRILLVSDYRFHDPAPLYRAALDELGVAYDEWETGWAGTGRGSPSLTLLKAYDMVLWYTGYDWYEPLTTAEADSLVAYLENGGRLFLSSQDFLFYNHDHALARDYLGLLDHRESVSPTLAYGNPAGYGDNGPFMLDYSQYQNSSDGLIPSQGSEVFLWHDAGGAAGLTYHGLGSTNRTWRTLFLAFPLELLPPAEHAAAMDHVLGYLGDLGDSTFEVSRRSAPAGSTLAYTLTLRHGSNGQYNFTTVTNTLPAGLELVPGSLSGDAAYNAATRQITWQGELHHDSVQRITYRATSNPALPAGTRLDNAVAIHYERHDLTFSRQATTWLDAPDLGGAALLLSDNPLPPGRNLTITLSLPNTAGRSGEVSTTLRLPSLLHPLTHTLSASAGNAVLTAEALTWQGTIAGNSAVTVTLSFTTTWRNTPRWQPLNLIIDDGTTAPLVRPGWLYIAPYRVYMPAVWRE